MITEVELVDFLSHRDTRVAFGPGMNVIVGPNGAGKSSVVDAITFALFGKHMRRVNKSLVRHNSSSGYASVTFETGGRALKATRKIRGGVAMPVLEEASGEGWENVAAGERRQMGESTTREIEAAVGMNFERMQIASIVRQGELSRIIHESPKDFKVRINDIAGISDMDAAEGHMADLLAGFRAAIRERHGSDDTQLPAVRGRLEEARAGSGAAEREIRALGARRDGALSEVTALEAELERAVEAEKAAEVLESRRAELAEYAKQRGAEAAAEAGRIEGEAAGCRARLAELEAAGLPAGEIKARIAALEAELERAVEAGRALADLETRRRELAEHARQKGAEAAAEGERIRKEAGECRALLESARAGDGLRADLRAAREKSDAAEREIDEAERKAAALGERLETAARLTLRDGRCPVCNSSVESLNPLYVREHVEKDIADAKREIEGLREDAGARGARVDELSEAEGRAREAKSALEALGVSAEGDIEAMLRKADGLAEVSRMAEACAGGDWAAGEGIDGQARAHCEAIAALEARAGGAGGRAAAEIEAEIGAARRADDAAAFLADRSVAKSADIGAMERRGAGLREIERMAAACAGGDWRAGEGIDGQARAHCEAIAALEGKAGGAGGRGAPEIEAEIGAARRADDAATFLTACSVAGAGDIEAMEARAAGLRGVERMAAACAGGDWRAAAGIDDQARRHCEEISALEARAGGAGGRAAAEVRASLDAARGRLEEASKARGAAEERARALSESIERDGELASELEAVAEYVKMLEEIRDVYRRDGQVATSMRTWALEAIARGSTDHLALLGTRINRITLSEKGRNVTISCHSGAATSEVDSLSGGEQVCVALALRLGMARVSGTRSPSYVILDEPTAHLDEERRRALARVLTNLAGTAEGRAPMQFIMITHDAEIFGEAPVERAYRFEPGPNGTAVSEIRGGA